MLTGEECADASMDRAAILQRGFAAKNEDVRQDALLACPAKALAEGDEDVSFRCAPFFF